MASIKTTFKLDGLKELDEALKDFSRATGGNILKRAVGTAGAMIAEHAIDAAPRDQGDLKREIKVAKPKIVNPGTAAFAQAMRETGDRAEAAAAARAANREAGGAGRSAVTHVGPTKRAGQGILQEFGTAHHKAQPFMRPTWDAYGGEAADVIRDTLAEEIDKARDRAAKRAARIAAKIK
jgi:HK97 gp10 family phage protein